MTTKDSGGIPSRKHDLRPNARRDDPSEKLKKLHEGKVSDKKAESANAQMTERGQNEEKGVESQSKPEYNSQGQMSHESEPEPHSQKGKQSDKFESEHQSQEKQQSSETVDSYKSNDVVDLDMSDASPEREHQDYAPPRVSKQNSDGKSNVKIGRILENFQELSMQDEDEKPEAFFMSGRSVKFIIRCGPPGAAWYKISSGNGLSTKGLQNVSDEDTRILKVKYKDEGGRKHRRYGKNNLGSIIAVVIVEHSNPTKRYKMAPKTYVKLEFHDIDEKDKKRLTDGCCWETRTDVVDATDAELANTKIIRTWNAQEEDRLDYIEGDGQSSPDRESSVCPLDDFFKEKKEEKLREEGLSTRMKEQPTFNSSFPSTGKSADPGKFKRSDTQFPKPANIKQELDDDNSLFVSPASPKKPKTMDVDDQNHEEKRKPREFSKKSYMKEMAEVDEWDDMDDSKRREERAIALANYHHYCVRMKELGYVEVN